MCGIFSALLLTSLLTASRRCAGDCRYTDGNSCADCDSYCWQAISQGVYVGSVGIEDGMVDIREDVVLVLTSGTGCASDRPNCEIPVELYVYGLNIDSRMYTYRVSVWLPWN